MKKTKLLSLNIETKYGLGVRTLQKALGYEKTRNAILKHVNDDDKSILEDLRRGPQIRAPFKVHIPPLTKFRPETPYGVKRSHPKSFQNRNCGFPTIKFF